MDQIPISTRADEKALEIDKMGKVTAIVVAMHLYGNAKSNLISTSAKNSAKNTKLVEVCPYRDSSLGNRDPYVGILVPTRDPLP